MIKHVIICLLALGILGGLAFFFWMNARNGSQISEDKGKDKSILEAALRGDVKALRRDFDKKSHLSLVDDQGYTVLMLATDGGNKEAVEFLLNAGADINAEMKDGTTALVIAVNAQYADLVDLLISRGATVDVKSGHDQYTPLMDAVEGGNMRIVKTLLQAGASLTEKNLHGHTLLNYAITDEMKLFLQGKMAE